MSRSGPDPTIRSVLDAHGLDATRAAPVLGGAPLRSASEPEYRSSPDLTVRLVVEQLARVHAVRAPLGAAHLGPDEVVAAAATGGSSQRAPGDLAGPYRHIERDRLVEVLRERAPSDPVTVVLTHGRPTLDSLQCRLDTAIGFSEWALAAWSDPHRDLARACTDLAAQLGPATVPRFAELYQAARPEVRIDPLLIDWWALAAELGG